MSDKPIFTSWRNYAEAWGQEPLCLQHRLHEDPLFSLGALAELVERYPREHYQLVQWGPLAERATWREGELGNLTGPEIIEAVRKSRVWINLRNVPTVDKRYGALLDAIFDELSQRIPGFETFSRTLGILISSPLSRTLYHADLPGQSLWQISGRKRVYLYPRKPPFITDEQIEDIALTGVEARLSFEQSFDDHASVFDIEPGQMLHWPLNAPHRVDNFDCLNVSMTLEYFTQAIRRRHMVTVANGLLRSRFGVTPRSHAIGGPSFWAKAVLQKAMRPKPRAHELRPPQFRLDPRSPDAVATLEMAST